MTRRVEWAIPAAVAALSATTLAIWLLRGGSSTEIADAKPYDASAADRSPYPALPAVSPSAADLPTPDEVGLSAHRLDSALARLSSAIAGHAELWDRPELAAGGRQADGAAATSGAGEIPRAERWQVYFAEGITVPDYARQLDFFKIELGAIGGEQVTYAFNVTRPTPETRKAPATAENRIYMSWRRGDLREADLRLMASAGVNVSDKVVVAFYPAQLEASLAEIEKKFAGREPAAIRQTRFGVRPVGGGYEFYVMDQSPLR